jgi:hypothetical protein
MLDWHVLANDLGALELVSERSRVLRTAAGRRIAQVGSSRTLTQELARNDVTEAALADVARIARLERTASELELRFGAQSAVAAVADSIKAGTAIGGIFRPDRRPPVPTRTHDYREPLSSCLATPAQPALRGAFTHAIDRSNTPAGSSCGTRAGLANGCPAEMDTGAPRRSMSRPPHHALFEPSGPVTSRTAGDRRRQLSLSDRNFGDPGTLPPVPSHAVGARSHATRAPHVEPPLPGRQSAVVAVGCAGRESHAHLTRWLARQRSALLRADPARPSASRSGQHRATMAATIS